MLKMKRMKISDMQLKGYDWYIVDVASAPENLKQIAEQLTMYVTKDVISSRILKKFSEFSFYIAENDLEVGQDIETAFYMEFCRCVHLSTFDILHLYSAFTKEYNALENYDRTEESYSGTKRDNATENKSNTLGTSQTINYKTTQDSNEQQTARTTTDSRTDSENNTTEYSNNSKINFDGNETEGFNEVQKNENRTHGNIGVTTAPQMLTQELQLRLKNLYYRIIDSICYELLILVNVD